MVLTDARLLYNFSFIQLWDAYILLDAEMKLKIKKHCKIVIYFYLRDEQADF